MQKSKRHQRPVAAALQESRSAEALTIGWLLSVMTTLLCVCGALVARWIGVARLPVLSGLLLFAALVIGVASLGLGVLIRRVRSVPPPRGVYVFATVVGILPILAVILDALL
ncbi:MAG: hypothetical protein SGJ19_19385 [Planctomycetia bacterium]|nr:hypothetical protein [Planctomycetia bacterium]